MMSRIRKFVVRVVLPAAFGLAVLGAGTSMPVDQDPAPKADASMTLSMLDIYWN